MKKILITGSNGLIGQKLICLLKKRGISNFLATSKGENRLKSAEPFDYEPFDITDSKRAEDIFLRFQPEIIIHTAAMSSVDPCENNRDACLKANTESVRTLIRLCEKKSAHLIHFSTDHVFDGTKDPYREEDPTCPVNFYGQSKVQAEKLLQESSIPWSAIRTILVYGVPENRSRNNIVLWAKESLEMGKTIRVATDQFRSPTLAEDLAEATIEIAVRKATGIYHISGDERMSVLEMVKVTAAFFKLDPALIQPVVTAELKEPARRPAATSFVLDKARRNLDYRPHSFLEGLKLAFQNPAIYKPTPA